jgi:hypothetical protein
MTKKTKGQDFNPLRTGVDPRKERGAVGEGGVSWLKLESGKHQDVFCLVEVDNIIVCEQCAIWLDDGNSPVWVYTGPEDPSHELKIDRRYKAYLPVMTEDGEVKVWGMGKSAHKQIMDIADAVGDIAGLKMRLKRTGAGLNTRYSIVSMGKYKNVGEVEEVDVVSMLGPITPDAVREMIAEKLGMDDYEDVVTSYRGKKGIKKSGGKTKPVAPVEETEDDDEEEIDDLDLE